MKFIGLILLLASLYFSWEMFSGKGVVVSEAVHTQIQQNLSKEMIQVIIAQNPDAFNIEVTDFWTKTIDETNITAHFQFSYDKQDAEGAVTKISKSGKALLEKVKEESETQFWNANEVIFEGQKIEFSEGLTFISGEE